MAYLTDPDGFVFVKAMKIDEPASAPIAGAAVLQLIVPLIGDTECAKKSVVSSFCVISDSFSLWEVVMLVRRDSVCPGIGRSFEGASRLVTWKSLFAQAVPTLRKANPHEICRILEPLGAPRP
jgi:hypothetical protein